ncbi:MAG: WhiB family transcriptional regulator [Actinobacteria bacterium]|nr:WhiB family transcriptional regulator [Actinomycetota bacterium]
MARPLAISASICQPSRVRPTASSDDSYPSRADLEINVSILASALALGSADYSWRSEAICRDTDPELFFPVGTTGQALLQIDRAKQVCNECNVRVSCLEFALETNQDSGIWGGTSEEERRNIRRQIAARNRVALQNRATTTAS